jgi:hypothetical protein
MLFELLFKQKVLEFQIIYNDYYDLVSFTKELDICTKGKPFRIHNSVIFNMVISRRNKLFIDVVEYIDSLAIGKKNFLNILKAQHIISIRLPSKKRAPIRIA